MVALFRPAAAPLDIPGGGGQAAYRWHLWRERFASYHRILTYSEFEPDLAEASLVYRIDGRLSAQPGWCDAGPPRNQ